MPPKDSKEVPSSADFGSLQTFLTSKGMSPAQITAAIGIASVGRTRLEIANQLREWLRNLK